MGLDGFEVLDFLGEGVRGRGFSAFEEEDGSG